MMPSGVAFKGTIKVKFRVRADGTTDRFECMTPLTDGTAPSGTVDRVLGRMEAAVHSCAFEPGRDPTGKPMDIWLLLPIHFARE
jgi:hypothetical protein